MRREEPGGNRSCGGPSQPSGPRARKMLGIVKSIAKDVCGCQWAMRVAARFILGQSPGPPLCCSTKGPLLRRRRCPTIRTRRGAPKGENGAPRCLCQTNPLRGPHLLEFSRHGDFVVELKVAEAPAGVERWPARWAAKRLMRGCSPNGRFRSPRRRPRTRHSSSRPDSGQTNSQSLSSNPRRKPCIQPDVVYSSASPWRCLPA